MISKLSTGFLIIALSCMVQGSLRAEQSGGNIFQFKEGVQIEFLEDASNKLTFGDILSDQFAQQFNPFTGDSFNFGLNGSSYWLRITMADGIRDKYDFIEVVNPYIDEVYAYIPVADNEYGMQRAGDSIPFSERSYPSRTFIFDLLGEQDKTAAPVYYLQFRTAGNLYFLLNLWSEYELQKYLSRSHTLLGLYFGLLLIVCIYSLVMCLRLREQTYCYYSLYTGAVIYFMLSMNGLGYEYLWTEFPYFARVSAAASTGIFILAGLLFSRVFLHTSKLVPRLDRLLLFLMGLAFMQVVIAFMGAIGLAAKLATAQAVCTPAIIWFTAVVVWKNGYRPARFLVVAWTVFLATIMINGLTNLGMLPANVLTVYAIHAGSALELLLISFALSDRMAILKQEKEELQSAYLFKLEATNNSLERMVEERTSELKEVTEQAQSRAQLLEAANVELKELSTRDSMTGLLNHQAFFEQFEYTIKNARRYEYYLSVLLIDIDDFKHINDSHGHLVGNEVIKAVADILESEIRESDIAARFGGEEFIIVLSHATLTEALEKAEKIRKHIEQISISNADDIHCTISTGITTLDWHNKDIDMNEVIRFADSAMYAAKAQGKNRIKVAEIDYKIVNGNNS